MILALTSISSWYGSYSALGFPVTQYLELLLTHRAVNRLSNGYSAMLTPRLVVVVVLMTGRWALIKPLLPRTTWSFQERTMGVLSRTAPPGTHDSTRGVPSMGIGSQVMPQETVRSHPMDCCLLGAMILLDLSRREDLRGSSRVVI